jgi:hypothetical protein
MKELEYHVLHGKFMARTNWRGNAIKPGPLHRNTWKGSYFNNIAASLIKVKAL